jgi:hypothetical protein
LRTFLWLIFETMALTGWDAIMLILYLLIYAINWWDFFLLMNLTYFLAPSLKRNKLFPIKKQWNLLISMVLCPQHTLFLWALFMELLCKSNYTWPLGCSFFFLYIIIILLIIKVIKIKFKIYEWQRVTCSDVFK